MSRARYLRKNATPAEQKLWRHLRNREIAGYKFRRQHPVGPYVLDFYCPAARLAIEVDGSGHSFSPGQEHDSAPSISQWIGDPCPEILQPGSLPGIRRSVASNLVCARRLWKSGRPL